MTQAAAVIHVGGEREEREILPVHVVFLVKHAGETGTGDLRFVPRPVCLLGRKKITQAALHAQPVKIATRANAHDCPGRLRSSAFAFSFGRRIFVSGTRFAPATVVVLTTFEPIASAQNPVLCHVLSNGAQPAQDLPGAINIIYAPASIPRAIVFLGGDQIPNRALYDRIVSVEVDVTEKLKCPRRQIAAS